MRGVEPPTPVAYLSVYLYTVAAARNLNGRRRA